MPLTTPLNRVTNLGRVGKMPTTKQSALYFGGWQCSSMMEYSARVGALKKMLSEVHLIYASPTRT